jgi:hypothetical protein
LCGVQLEQNRLRKESEEGKENVFSELPWKFDINDGHIIRRLMK